MRGASAQDYHNLEILVSDDYSPDRTFDVIRAVADSYAGRHRLIVNWMPQNVGISRTSMPPSAFPSAP